MSGQGLADYTSHTISSAGAGLSASVPRAADGMRADLAGLRAMGFVLGSVTAAVVMIGAFVVTAQIRQGGNHTRAAMPYAAAADVAPVSVAPEQPFDVSIYTGYGPTASPLVLSVATSAMSDTFLPARVQ